MADSQNSTEVDPAQCQLRLENAQSYLEGVIKELRSLDSKHKGTLLNVLEYLSRHIHRTRDEIGALRTTTTGEPLLSSTTDELEEILVETAKAAHQIMGASEEIEALASQTNPAIGEKLRNAVTRIFEASAFQDITGQRITKIVRALQSIETKIHALSFLCDENANASQKAIDPKDKDSLLNGPQLSILANTQDDIDRLFNDGE
jgi:chemotaxis protein CheZ